MNYNVPDKDVCVNLEDGVKCPLEDSQIAVYHLKLPITGRLPSVTGTVKFELINDKGRVMTCFKLTCQLVS